MEGLVTVDENGVSDEEKLVQEFIQAFEEEIVDVRFHWMIRVFSLKRE